jgi:Fur family ferric uptake transcriptional regulator
MIAATQSNHPLAGVSAAPKDEASTLETACVQLRQAEMRITKPRVAILAALIKRDQPVAIEQLHQELAGHSCDLVTVYRCLAAFEEIGLVRRSFLHNGTALYEMAHASRPRHYHIVCKACGKTENLNYFSVDGMERMLTERGYTQLTHIVEFFGVCPTCQQQQSIPARSVAPGAVADRNAAPVIPSEHI